MFQEDPEDLEITEELAAELGPQLQTRSPHLDHLAQIMQMHALVEIW